ncbi:MAG: glycosyltransferase [Tepidisphaeraceae bacterium]
MRVLHINSSIDPISGGTAAALSGLAKAQARAGMKVTVLATWVAAPGVDAAKQMEAAGVAVHSVRATDPMSRHPQLRAIVERHVRDADVVHVHAMWEAIQHQAARACQRLGVPYVMTPHGMLDPWNMSHGAMKKRLYLALRMRRNLERAAAIHFATEMERDWVARLRLPTPTIVEPLGVDVDEFADLPQAGSFRDRHEQVGRRPMIAFLGRLHAGKGVELLIPALARMPSKNSVLVVAGPDSGYAATARKTATALGVADRVVFTGMLHGRDRLALLADADLFALPSYHENFGIAVIEALAVGTPVIVSDQVCLHREISDAGVGAVVRTEVGCLASELQRWLTDDALRANARARARPFAVQRYDWAAIANRWRNHYEGVAGRGRALESGRG